MKSWSVNTGDEFLSAYIECDVNKLHLSSVGWWGRDSNSNIFLGMDEYSLSSCFFWNYRQNVQWTGLIV